MKNKTNSLINIYSLIFIFLYVMPFVDSLSGAFHDEYPIGQIFRLMFFVLLLFFLLKVSKRKFGLFFCSFLLFILLQVVASFPDAYLYKSIQDTIKLFTPMGMIVLFQCLITKRIISKHIIFDLLDWWSVIYPLLIIIPSILGLSSSAYDSSVGYKGFFYAINEISFIMSSLVISRFFILSIKLSFSSLIILGIDTICLILMGTKTGYASIIVGSIIFGIYFFKERNIRRIYKYLVVLGFVFLFILLFQNAIISMVSGIVNRWVFQRQISNSTIDFLFSMRLRRLKDAFDSFLHGSFILFGWGFGGELGGMINVEMDFIDLLLRTGILGFSFVVLFYWGKVRTTIKHSIWGGVIVGWSFALSFGAGHVLFYGQSGMMLAMNIIYSSLISSDALKKYR